MALTSGKSAFEHDLVDLIYIYIYGAGYIYIYGAGIAQWLERRTRD